MIIFNNIQFCDYFVKFCENFAIRKIPIGFGLNFFLSKLKKHENPKINFFRMA